MKWRKRPSQCTKLGVSVVLLCHVMSSFWYFLLSSIWLQLWGSPMYSKLLDCSRRRRVGKIWMWSESCDHISDDWFRIWNLKSNLLTFWNWKPTLLSLKSVKLLLVVSFYFSMISMCQAWIHIFMFEYNMPNISNSTNIFYLERNERIYVALRVKRFKINFVSNSIILDFLNKIDRLKESKLPIFETKNRTGFFVNRIVPAWFRTLNIIEAKKLYTSPKTQTFVQLAPTMWRIEPARNESTHSDVSARAHSWCPMFPFQITLSSADTLKEKEEARTNPFGTKIIPWNDP